MATTFAIKRLALHTTLMVVTLLLHVACRANPPMEMAATSDPTSASLASIPITVNRLAIWYPRTFEKDVAYGYARLEQAIFQGKKHRPWLRILERRDLEALKNERGLHLTGEVSDETAISIGKWLGADSVVLFHIDGPSWRERMLARIQETMPPFTVLSKIIAVESGEVLYHDIVTFQPVPESGKWDDYARDYEVKAALQPALNQALTVAAQRLEQSFQ
jgi:hypothetical protein